MYCFKKCLWHCCGFWPPQWFGVRGIYPLPHSLRLWCYAIKIEKCSENKQIFISKRHELLFHKHLQFSNTIRHGFCKDCQQRLLAAIQVSSCSFASLLCLPHAFFWRGPVFVLRIIKLFRHSTSYFFKVRLVWAQYRNCFEGRICSGNVPECLGNDENAI